MEQVWPDDFRALAANSRAEREAAAAAKLLPPVMAPSQVISQAAQAGNLTPGLASLMERVSQSGLDAYYSGPRPQELAIRDEFQGMASRGALAASGNRSPVTVT